MKQAGKLFVIEGNDGVGKSTQIAQLESRLKSDGLKIASHHFPTYYSYQGKGVEKYLAGEYGKPEDLSPYFINSLYAYDRAITWRIKLQQLYDKGRTILLDRYTTSSLIYQSTPIDDIKAKNQFLDYVSDFEYRKLGIREPDIVFFLAAPFDLITKMREQRAENDGIKNDVHERDHELLRKVNENALYVAEYLHWNIIDCSTTDHNNIRSIEDIHQEIYQTLKSKNLL